MTIKYFKSVVSSCCSVGAGGGDLYAVMCVDKDATQEDIKRAYRKVHHVICTCIN